MKVEKKMLVLHYTISTYNNAHAHVEKSGSGRVVSFDTLTAEYVFYKGRQLSHDIVVLNISVRCKVDSFRGGGEDCIV